MTRVGGSAGPEPGTPVRVLILDESAFVRKLLGDVLSADREIEVIGAATIGELTADTLEALDPDVIVLDPQRLELVHPAALERLAARRSPPWVSIADTVELSDASRLQA